MPTIPTPPPIGPMTTTPTPPPIPTGCGGVYTELSGELLSPNYPQNYPNNARCEYHIVVPEGWVSTAKSFCTLRWRHNERDSVSNHQPHDCLFNCLFRRSSKKTSNLRVTGLFAGNSPVTREFPAQRASNAKNGSIWWRHHERSRGFNMTL